MKELEELVSEFARHVIAQTDCIWRGDSKAGNKHARKYISAFARLRAHGDEGREALCALLIHPNMDVRNSAAAYLLRYRTEQARAVLEEAARGTGLIPFEASIVLKNWDAGQWQLDPDEITDPPRKRK